MLIKALLEQIEKIGDNENLCVVTSGSDDTKIDLSTSGSMSDDDGDSDEDSSLVGKVIKIQNYICANLNRFLIRFNPNLE